MSHFMWDWTSLVTCSSYEDSVRDFDYFQKSNHCKTNAFTFSHNSEENRGCYHHRDVFSSFCSLKSLWCRTWWNIANIKKCQFQARKYQVKRHSSWALSTQERSGSKIDLWMSEKYKYSMLTESKRVPKADIFWVNGQNWNVYFRYDRYLTDPTQTLFVSHLVCWSLVTLFLKEFNSLLLS